MTENPYAAPSAAVLAGRIGEPIRLYSPTQVACGTIGGPVGLIYFLKANFSALGNDAAARKTLIFGALLILCLVALLPFLPEKVPNSPFTIAYILIARGVAQKYQMTKQTISDSPRYDFQSNWRVFGLGLLCLVGSVAVIMGPLMLLAVLGVWNP
jgi:hypothetical protein